MPGPKTNNGPERRVGELWFAFALFAFALAALWQAYGISGFAGLSTAGVFPMLAAGTMVLSAATIIVNTWQRPSAADTSLTTFLAQTLPARLLLLLALVTAFLIAMPYAGFMPAAAVFLYAAIALLWRRGLLAPALVTVLAMALIWITFRVAFQIVLPRGVLIPTLL